MAEQLEKQSQEVYVARDAIVVVSGEDLAFLKEQLPETKRHRVRLCAHRGVEDRLHEMFILVSRETYIRPHKHMQKAESLLVVEGEADAVFFDDEGKLTDVIPLGDAASGRPFYYRIDSPRYHTLLFRSPHLLFHESTTGPFRKEETIYAPWAPVEEDHLAARRYIEDLSRAAGEFPGRERHRGPRP